jgi:hypothetical protein
MYRNEWYLSDGTSGTCTYVFEFVRAYEGVADDYHAHTFAPSARVGDWYLVDDHLGEDLSRCLDRATTLPTAVPTTTG